MLKRKIRLLTAIILIMSVFIGCQSNKNEETKKKIRKEPK